MQVHLVDSTLEKFIQSLDKATIAKVVRMIELLEQFGNQLGMPHSKKIGQKLYELRIRGRQEVRIFYTFHNASIILLHGCVKKSDKIPIRELEGARKKLSALD